MPAAGLSTNFIQALKELSRSTSPFSFAPGGYSGYGAHVRPRTGLTPPFGGFLLPDVTSGLWKRNNCQARIIANRKRSSIWRDASVPWYFFTVLAPDGAAKGAGSTNLLDDDAARHYGHLIIRELKQREG